MNTIAERVKRTIETPRGERVMLPEFGCRLWELVDKTMDEKYRLLFIAYTFEAFFDTKNSRLWDEELEPVQIVINNIDDHEISATIILTNGEEVVL